MFNDLFWDCYAIKELEFKHYTEVALEQYLDYLNKESIKEYIIFTPENQKATIEMACIQWKKEFAKLFGYTLALDKDFKCSKEQFETSLDASTSSQKDKFKLMFLYYFHPELKKDTILYVKSVDKWEIQYFHILMEMVIFIVLIIN